MSMNEFNKFPSDFSEEDVEFACELDALFAIDQEDMPPLFVQTLMSSDDPRLQPVDGGIEVKTRANVFRRLHLKRRLFRSSHLSLRALCEALLASSRPLLVLGTSFLLFVILTVTLTGPTFAVGLNYLWAGAHSGVLQVNGFPHLSATTNHSSSSTAQKSTAQESNTNGISQLSLYSAINRLHFPLSVPLSMPARYSQRDLYLYEGDPSWADGPIMVLDYTYALPGIAPRHITICEFKPQGDVFQVVQDGAAHRILINDHNSLHNSAIYVEGRWTQIGNSSYTWDRSERSELIMETNGVAIWIVGDKRDGINQDALTVIARSFLAYQVPFDHPGGHLEVTQSSDGTPSIFDNDVIYLNNPDNPDGPSFKLIGASPAAHHHPHYKPSQN